LLALKDIEHRVAIGRTGAASRHQPRARRRWAVAEVQKRIDAGWTVRRMALGGVSRRLYRGVPSKTPAQ
jgi:hypothetical protein